MAWKLEAGKSSYFPTQFRASASFGTPRTSLMLSQPGRAQAASQRSEQQLPKVLFQPLPQPQGVVVNFCTFYHWLISTNFFFSFSTVTLVELISKLNSLCWNFEWNLFYWLDTEWHSPSLSLLHPHWIFLSLEHQASFHLKVLAILFAWKFLIEFFIWLAPHRLGLCSTVTSSERPPLTTLFKSIS